MIIVSMSHESVVPQALQTDDGGILIVPANSQIKPRYCKNRDEARNFLVTAMTQDAVDRINELLTRVEQSYDDSINPIADDS